MGLLITAAITTILATAFYGLLIARLGGRDNWRLLCIAFLVALPLQPLAFYAVRAPLSVGFEALLGAGSALTIVSAFYAPLTEEPAKWLTLLVPAIRRRLTPQNAVVTALAVGLGFGLGEIWMLAANLVHLPEVAALPFYRFGGFFAERFAVCLMHGAFIAYAFVRLAQGRSFLIGGLFGITLHFLLNLPVFVAAFHAFGIGPAAWHQLLTIWVAGFAVAMALTVARMYAHRSDPKV